jgi:hypothetical protein
MKTKLTKLPDEIIITVDYKTKRVLTKDYVMAKTKSLREFGYDDLKEKTVEDELLKVLNKGKLSVIGMFIKGEVERADQ